jgi:hypothetical protein
LSDLPGALEAILFSSNRPLKVRELAQATDSDRVAVEVALDELREQLAVQRRDPGTAGQHLVEAVQLRESDRTGDVRQAIVEAEAVVVEPAHVRGAALVSLGVDPLLQRRVGHRDHAPLARGQLLVGVEAEHRRVPARAHPDPVGMDRPQSLAGVLDDRQAEHPGIREGVPQKGR